MATWIVLLRGINVGGKNTLPMKALVGSLTEAGFQNVQTYIQSGNVVLESTIKRADAVAREVARIIATDHGVQVVVVALSRSEFATAVDANPFPDATRDPKSLHLIVLEETPAASSTSALDALTANGESFRIEGRMLYLHAPAGVGRSIFVKGFESALGMAGTARNWRTVLKLCDLAGIG
jgi:uncharacterized protein (DUF1697 family)